VRTGSKVCVILDHNSAIAMHVRGESNKIANSAIVRDVGVDVAVEKPADRRIGVDRGEGTENRTLSDFAAAHANAVECTDRERYSSSADKLLGDPLTGLAVSDGDGEEFLFVARQKLIGTDDPVTIHHTRVPIFHDKDGFEVVRLKS